MRYKLLAGLLGGKQTNKHKQTTTTPNLKTWIQKSLELPQNLKQTSEVQVNPIITQRRFRCLHGGKRYHFGFVCFCFGFFCAGQQSRGTLNDAAAKRPCINRNTEKKRIKTYFK